MRHLREPDERLAGTGRRLSARALLREGARRPGNPAVTSDHADWKRADGPVDSDRTIAGSRGLFANRTDAGDIG